MEGKTCLVGSERRRESQSPNLNLRSMQLNTGENVKTFYQHR